MRKFTSTILFFIIALSVFADEVKFTAQSSKVVAVGERFRYTLSLNAKGSHLQAPAMSDFSILTGPNLSQSSSVQIINGQVSQNVNYTYTFILIAQKEGKFTIPSAKITVNGKTYESNALTIEVVKGRNNSTANTQNANNNNVNSSQIEGIDGEDLFVRLNVSDRDVYQGEHIYATIKVYTRVDLAGFENMKFPSFDGFWTQEIETPSQVSLVRENVNGKIYNVGVIKKTLLFPQRSGELTIEPFDLDLVVRQHVKSKRRSIFDGFFGSYQNVKKNIKSPPVKIKVKPLPNVGKPADYNGAVGDFSFDSEIDQTDVTTNDAITLKYKIKGNGNLKLIDVPEINFPPDFEIYDPKITNNVHVGAGGASGTKTIEYLIIPRHAGKFRIPEVKFSYFNPALGKYKTITAKGYDVEVKRGEGDESTSVVSKGISKEDLTILGSDIRYLKTGKINLKKGEKYFYASLWFYLSYVGALILFIAVFILRKEQIKRNSNVALVKNRKASKVSRKRLKLAQAHLSSSKKEEFYEEVLKAYWEYLSNKLIIPVSELSKDAAIDKLAERGVQQETIDAFFEVTDICEFARYAPAGEETEMLSLYQKALKVIDQIEQQIK